MRMGTSDVSKFVNVDDLDWLFRAQVTDFFDNFVRRASVMNDKIDGRDVWKDF